MKNKWNGFILVNIKNRSDGLIKAKKCIINTITNNALNEIVKSLIGGSSDMEIKYLALGAGTTSPAASDTKLSNETYRIDDTSLAITSTGQVTSEFTLTGAEYIAEVPSGEIEEIGIFAGSGADPWSLGAGKDTGLLIARVLFNYTITADEDLYIERIDLIGG